MIAAMAIVLAASEIFLKSQVQGWTVSKAVLSCRADKKVDWFKRIAILKGNGESASLFLDATEYGADYFGDVRITQPAQKFDIFFTKGFNWESAWAAHDAEAMMIEGRVEIMTTVSFADLVEKSKGADGMVFMQGKDKMASFLIEGLPNALAILEKCSNTLSK